jgi:hypothetical protein
MIAIRQRGHLRLVVLSIPLQPGNSLFHRAAKPRTDLKAFLGGTFADHGWHLNTGIPEAKNNSSKASGFSCLCR